MQRKMSFYNVLGGFILTAGEKGEGLVVLIQGQLKRGASILGHVP